MAGSHSRCILVEWAPIPTIMTPPLPPNTSPWVAQHTTAHLTSSSVNITNIIEFRVCFAKNPSSSFISHPSTQPSSTLISHYNPHTAVQINIDPGIAMSSLLLHIRYLLLTTPPDQIRQSRPSHSPRSGLTPPLPFIHLTPHLFPGYLRKPMLSPFPKLSWFDLRRFAHRRSFDSIHDIQTTF